MAKSKSKSAAKSVAKRSKRSKTSKRSKRSKRSKASKGSKGSSKHVAWCVRCRSNVKMTGCKLTKAKNGRLMLKGKCAECGTKVNRFVKDGTKSC